MTTKAFTTENPFLQVYKAIWNTLESSNEFRATFREGNRIKYHGAGDRSPDKDFLATADHAQVRVRPAGGDLLLQTAGGKGRKSGDRGSSTATQNFNIDVATGDKRIFVLFDAKWAIFKAMASIHTGDEDTEHLELNFVEDVRFVSINETDRDSEQRPIGGWITVMVIQVTMEFDTEKDLQS